MCKTKTIQRKIIFYRNYFLNFYKNQNDTVKRKINFVLQRLEVEKTVSRQFFKKIVNVEGLFEIRISAEGNIFRIFCCFDKGNIIVLFNAFQKKTQKTPKGEIKKALEIKKKYFNKRD